MRNISGPTDQSQRFVALSVSYSSIVLLHFCTLQALAATPSLAWTEWQNLLMQFPRKFTSYLQFSLFFPEGACACMHRSRDESETMMRHYLLFRVPTCCWCVRRNFIDADIWYTYAILFWQACKCFLSANSANILNTHPHLRLPKLSHLICNSVGR